MERDGAPWTLLARGAGAWTGTEEMPPAPWAPDGLRSRATMDARLVLGGRGLASDYVQTRADGSEMRSHTLIRWHAEEEVFLMEFSSEESREAMILPGRRSGDAIAFEGPGPGGAPMRQTMTWSEGRLTVRSESAFGDEGWTTTFSGEYQVVEPHPAMGAIGWHDLTVDRAEEARDFYTGLVGWSADPVEMDGYADWTVLDAEGDAVAGICHRRGVNEGLPPAWLLYVYVDGLDRRLGRVEELGGRIVDGPRAMGGPYRVAVVEDPAGAVLALYETKGASS